VLYVQLILRAEFSGKRIIVSREGGGRETRSGGKEKEKNELSVWNKDALPIDFSLQPLGHRRGSSNRGLELGGTTRGYKGGASVTEGDAGGGSDKLVVFRTEGPAVCQS